MSEAVQGEDTRQSGPDFTSTNTSELFVADTEPLPVPKGQSILEADADEEACTLLVTGYPSDGDLNQVYNYFMSIGALRRMVERNDQGIRVIFRQKSDLESALDWVGDKDMGGVKIGGTVVHVHKTK